MADLDSLAAIFKAYDVRGTVPDQLDAGLAERIGAAFARFVADTDGADRVLVARDMRPSGVELAAAFAEGVQRQGLDVVDLGLASTDMVYFAAGTLDAPGAMFTASSRVVADSAHVMGDLAVPPVFASLPFDLEVERRTRRHVPQPLRLPDPAREPPRPAGQGARDGCRDSRRVLAAVEGAAASHGPSEDELTPQIVLTSGNGLADLDRALRRARTSHRGGGHFSKRGDEMEATHASIGIERCLLEPEDADGTEATFRTLAALGQPPSEIGSQALNHLGIIHATDHVDGLPMRNEVIVAIRALDEADQ